jgi:hypothetical protein
MAIAVPCGMSVFDGLTIDEPCDEVRPDAVVLVASGAVFFTCRA